MTSIIDPPMVRTMLILGMMYQERENLVQIIVTCEKDLYVLYSFVLMLIDVHTPVNC